MSEQQGVIHACKNVLPAHFCTAYPELASVGTSGTAVVKSSFHHHQSIIIRPCSDCPSDSLYEQVFSMGENVLIK